MLQSSSCWWSGENAP